MRARAPQTAARGYNEKTSTDDSPSSPPPPPRSSSTPRTAMPCAAAAAAGLLCLYWSAGNNNSVARFITFLLTTRSIINDRTARQFRAPLGRISQV